MTLDQSGQSFISLRNTMEYLTRYIEMEQIRNSHFTCRIMADDELDPDETVLPPMLIQPFVENAIWHGVTGNQKSININIDFKKQGSRLVCIIEDNGIGIKEALKNKINGTAIHRSVGIENIYTRIGLLNEKYNFSSSVQIQDKSGLAGHTGTGTVVTLHIPLEMKEQ
jgi:sensor histidine kinase YesM